MQIILRDIDENNLHVFRQINIEVLPLSYTDKWYSETLDVGQLAKSAYHGSQMIGAIRCAFLRDSGLDGIYIMTLAVLSPFRNSGVGTALLNHLKRHARAIHVNILYLHAWEKSLDSMNWYRRHGFTVHSRIEGYYTRMKPKGNAYVMVLDLSRPEE